jgi:pSer/pThr/pTyr-binding forkhead associated (FHA) protein
MSIWLVMQSTDGVERQFAVRKNQTVIGRETTCDVRIPVPAVSQKHCRLTLDGNALRLTDLDSTNGTFHNGNRVKEAELSPEDKLTIGPVTFIIRINDDAILPDRAHTEIMIVRQDNGQVQTNLDG